MWAEQKKAEQVLPSAEKQGTSAELVQKDQYHKVSRLGTGGTFPRSKIITDASAATRTRDQQQMQYIRGVEAEVPEAGGTVTQTQYHERRWRRQTCKGS